MAFMSTSSSDADEVSPFCCSSKSHAGWVPICEPCVDKQYCGSTKHSIIVTGAVLGLFVIPVSMKIMGKSWFGGFSRASRAPRAPNPSPPPPPAAHPPPPRAPPSEPPLEPPEPETKSLLKYIIIGLLVAFRAYQYHFKSEGRPTNNLT